MCHKATNPNRPLNLKIFSFFLLQETGKQEMSKESKGKAFYMQSTESARSQRFVSRAQGTLCAATAQPLGCFTEAYLYLFSLKHSEF